MVLCFSESWQNYNLIVVQYVGNVEPDKLNEYVLRETDRLVRKLHEVYANAIDWRWNYPPIDDKLKQR